MKKSFLVNSRRKMFSVFEKLEKEAHLNPKRDFGVISLAPQVRGSQNVKFWINGIEKPLVRKILIENNLR